MPVRALAEYAALILVLAGAVLLAARLLRVPLGRRPGSVVVGSPWLEAEDAYDAVLREHRRHLVTASLSGHRDRLDLPTLDDVAPVGQYLGQHSRGERSIPVQHIVGSADGANHLFDRDFRPMDERARDRFLSVYVAMRTGEPLPPIEVYKWRSDYFVIDGLHRVAVARALGHQYIAAEVIDLTG
jgi:hypothetical protein